MVEKQVELTIQCPYAHCVHRGVPVLAQIPQGVVEELSQQGTDDRIMSPLCGHIWNLTEDQKAFLVARFKANMSETRYSQGPNEVSSLQENPRKFPRTRPQSGPRG